LDAEQSRELMRRITAETWDEGRLELVDELIAEDFVDHVELPGLDGAGRARYRASVETTRDTFSDFRNPLDVVVAEGDIAVSWGRMTGTHDGDGWGMPPTGKRIDAPVVGMLRFRDGQAVERWGVTDMMTMLQQLGMLG
jgi:predicted ester cyclase